MRIFFSFERNKEEKVGEMEREQEQQELEMEIDDAEFICSGCKFAICQIVAFKHKLIFLQTEEQLFL